MDGQQEQMQNELIAGLKQQLVAMTTELELKNRELEVQDALEEVRVRATAMRESSELAETSAVLFQQLNKLQIKAIRTGVGIFDEPNDAMEIWLTTYSHSQEVIRILDYVNLHVHPVFENIIPARKQKKTYAVTQLTGIEVRQYYQTMSTYISLQKQSSYNDREYFYSFFFLQGAINVNTLDSLSEEECDIMTRFAQVFGLIYTRFLDLKKAEMQTRDALRQTSLDRVRAEIASMRTADDLNHIPPLIWRELMSLNVPFFRCGIFIIREEEQLVHAYLSTPEGKSLAVLHLPFDGEDTTRKIVSSWRRNEVYTDYWDSEQFQSWVETMVNQGQIEQKEQYQASEAAPESLHLQFIPFLQGMLYVGSHDPLDESQIELLDSLADAFSVAYARYEDFRELEKAKQSVEATLSELKSTQTQLIQSEKMASLGELTAGIAHEIQNPLNFINNFSEINVELSEELIEAAHDENIDEIKSIAYGIKANEEKINHHGKRADAIVKSMLQHSHTGSGQKESVNINALCDEYFRIAYYGFRAKNKSFTAILRTHFDESVGNINIIPHDIGSVLLNLMNNAFYSVQQKEAALTVDYRADVTVQTRKTENQVSITVYDNGMGIPNHIREKVFQPFFTTKPTGAGTGLGLSLSYDIIVKGHGGRLELQTEEGKFTEFTVVLPLN
jgi:signal transduction histidine kinase